MAYSVNDNFIERVVRQYSAVIIRIAFPYTRVRADAEDIMQEVFLTLLKQPPFVTEEHMKAWIIRVTINKCKDFVKSKKRRESVLNYQSSYILPDEVNEVFDELSRLPEKDRNILYLFYYEGYKAKEIAEILNKKEKAVLMQLSRAREKLKKFLEEPEK